MTRRDRPSKQIYDGVKNAGLQSYKHDLVLLRSLSLLDELSVDVR